jgi:hypothetical protein
MKQIGARPGGMTAPEHPIVHSWLAASTGLGIKPFLLAGGSTDGGGCPSIWVSPQLCWALVAKPLASMP